MNKLFLTSIFFLLFSVSVVYSDEKKELIIIGLDVRSKTEVIFNKAPGAIHVPVSDISEETISKLPKDAQIKVFCEAGVRAEKAKKKLGSLGFKNIVNIGSWREWNKDFSQKSKKD